MRRVAIQHVIGYGIAGHNLARGLATARRSTGR